MTADDPMCLPSPPVANELWWVAVENAEDPSGGWLVLADPGPKGAAQIQSALSKAGIAFMAALDFTQLRTALKDTNRETVVAWKVHQGQAQSSFHEGSVAQVLVELRLAEPDDVLLLVESMDAAHELGERMRTIINSGSFRDIRMDLRSAPRGQGTWGLSLAKLR